MIKSTMNIRKAERALELWEDWFADDGDPIVDFPWGTECFFCREPREDHTHYCVYVKAKELLDE